MGYPHYPPSVKRRAVEMRREGKSVAEISKAIGANQSSVYSWLGGEARAARKREATAAARRATNLGRENETLAVLDAVLNLGIPTEQKLKIARAVLA